MTDQEKCSLLLSSENMACMDSDGDKIISLDELKAVAEANGINTAIDEDTDIPAIYQNALCDAVEAEGVLSEVERRELGAFTVQQLPGSRQEQCRALPPMS